MQKKSMNYTQKNYRLKTVPGGTQTLSLMDNPLFKSAILNVSKEIMETMSKQKISKVEKESANMITGQLQLTNLRTERKKRKVNRV